MRRRALVVGAVAIILAGGAGMAYWSRKAEDRRRKTEAALSSSANPSIGSHQPSSELNPLEIEAIRARSYPGGSLITEQALGRRGARNDFIVSFRSDGFKIFALMSVPDRVKPQSGWPVIILDHGYIVPSQYQTDGADYKSFIAVFTSAGYMVVKPDYRGHGQSEGVPEGGHYSPVYTYDNLNLIAALKNYSDVDPKRIGLFGHSLGGHLALRTIVVSKDVKATVTLAGVVGSMEDLFFNWPRTPSINDQPTGVVRGNLNKLIASEGDPHSNPDFWNKASAINFVDAVTGPVQINHDVGDSVVPKLFSDHLDLALTNAGKKHEYYLYPGDDHQFIQSRSQLLTNVMRFYAENL